MAPSAFQAGPLWYGDHPQMPPPSCNSIAHSVGHMRGCMQNMDKQMARTDRAVRGVCRKVIRQGRIVKRLNRRLRAAVEPRCCYTVRAGKKACTSTCQLPLFSDAFVGCSSSQSTADVCRTPSESNTLLDSPRRRSLSRCLLGRPSSAEVCFTPQPSTPSLAKGTAKSSSKSSDGDAVPASSKSKSKEAVAQSSECCGYWAPCGGGAICKWVPVPVMTCICPCSPGGVCPCAAGGGGGVCPCGTGGGSSGGGSCICNGCFWAPRKRGGWRRVLCPCTGGRRAGRLVPVRLRLAEGLSSGGGGGGADGGSGVCGNCMAEPCGLACMPRVAYSTPDQQWSTLSSLGRHLLAVAHEGDVVAAERLLDAGANPNFCAAGRWTPLHRACAKAHVDMVTLLLQRGAFPDACTACGLTPLHLASVNDYSGHCASLLICAGAHLDAWNRCGQAALHLAAACGNTAAARALVEAGASTNARDDAGHAPVDVAATACVVQVLMEGGKVNQNQKKKMKMPRRRCCSQEHCCCRCRPMGTCRFKPTCPGQ